MKRILKRLATIMAGGLFIVAALTITMISATRYSRFKEEMAGIGGVNFDDEQRELLYAHGRPSFVQKSDDGAKLIGTDYGFPTGGRIEDYPIWQWLTGTISLTVEFDKKSKRVNRISCFTIDQDVILGPCTTIGSITTGKDQSLSGHLYGSESYIISTLGDPSEVAYDHVDGIDRKTLFYDDLGLNFTMSGRKLLAIHMNKTDYDFVHWLLYGPSI